MVEREPGLYWVRLWAHSDWEIAQCLAPERWLIFDEDNYFAERHFAEIGDRVERAIFTHAELIERAKGDPAVPPLLLPPEVLMLFLKPQPITDAQKTGERFLVWYAADPAAKWGANPGDDPARENGWQTAWWDVDSWVVGGEGWESHLTLEERRVTHYLPLPPDIKP